MLDFFLSRMIFFLFDLLFRLELKKFLAGINLLAGIKKISWLENLSVGPKKLTTFTKKRGWNYFFGLELNFLAGINCLGCIFFVSNEFFWLEKLCVGAKI